MFTVCKFSIYFFLADPCLQIMNMGECNRGSPALGTDQVIYCTTCDLLKQYCETKKRIIFVGRAPSSENCFKYKPKTATTTRATPTPSLHKLPQIHQLHPTTTLTTGATPTTTTTPTITTTPSSRFL